VAGSLKMGLRVLLGWIGATMVGQINRAALRHKSADCGVRVHLQSKSMNLATGELASGSRGSNEMVCHLISGASASRAARFDKRARLGFKWSSY